MYYQHLFDVPVDLNPESDFSILNAFDVWDYFAIKEMDNSRTGRNMGIDMTLEKFFDKQYYFMLTGSLCDSKFTSAIGNTFNTRFNGNHLINVLGGKEFKMGKQNNKILGLNGKFIYAGGNLFTPINFEASQINQREIRYLDRLFESKSGAYYRLDVGLSYSINKKSTTHTIMFDIQNVTNRENPFSQDYDVEDNEIEITTQTGFFPFFNYRIEF